MVKMSRRDRQSAIRKIRCWSTEQLQKFLTDHDLGECCIAIRKREVDGETFLTLTEGQLAFWKRDLNLETIRKLVHLVQDVNAQPEKYAQADSNIVVHGKVSAVDVASDVSHTWNMQKVSSVSGKRTSPSDSWDTDFSDDDDDDISKPRIVANPVAAEVETEAVYCNHEALENVKTYSYSEALATEQMYRNEEKPPVPLRPPALALKPAPTKLAHSNSHNLPKPPVHEENIVSLVDMLHLPENTDQFDEEDYDSLDEGMLANKPALSALLQKLLQDRAQAAANKPPIPNTQPNQQMQHVPSQSTTFIAAANHVSAFRQTTQEPLAVEGHVNDGYESEEYESIGKNERPTQLLPGGGADEYVPPLQSSGGAHPLSINLWNSPAHATPPTSRPPSPPRPKLGGAPYSRGSPGNVVTRQIGENLTRRGTPGPINPQSTREVTPTRDVRDTTIPNPKRPLPPTPGRAVGPRALSQQPWYHNVDRRQAEEMLRNGKDGSFLVRPSKQLQNTLTLTLWYTRRPYNISVRQRSDGRCALGTEKANEQSFASVEDLIQNYQAEKLVLYSEGKKVGRTVLTTSPPQGYQHSM